MRDTSLNVVFVVHTVDPDRILSQICNHGILIENIFKDDAFTVRFSVQVRDYKELIALLKRRNLDFDILSPSNESLIKKIRSRPILKLALICLFVISLYFQGRILFIYVNGNQSIPTYKILEAASNNGIHFGAKTSSVRSECVKNGLLAQIPELQWIGITTDGCVATISVKESAMNDLSGVDTDMPISSIVASRDGVISYCNLQQGTVLCSPGQVVSEGEMLISGYIDCGIVIKAMQAKGEVFAQTEYNIKAISPSWQARSIQPIEKKVNYGVRIGKKLIFFNNSSRIYSSSCGKIYEEQYMVLPGGFKLPVCIIKETITTYRATQYCPRELMDESFLGDNVRAYLLNQMVAGEIVAYDEDTAQTDRAIEFTGRYLCSEMIGRKKSEAILQGDIHGN